MSSRRHSLARGTDSDLSEAEAIIDRLAASLRPVRHGSRVTSTCFGFAPCWLPHASNVAAYRELRDRYRQMANDLGYEGHMKWAAEMP